MKEGSAAIQMKEMLLPKDKEMISVSDQAFGVSAEELSDLFQPDNIRDGASLGLIKKWGGYRGIERLLKTNLKTGIEFTLQEKSFREEKYGNNAAIVKPPRTLVDMILQNFEDPTLRILCAAAIASLILGIMTHGWKEGWLEGVSILIAVVIIVGVTSFNNYVKEQQFIKLNAEVAKKDVNVVRNGRAERVDVQQLLVGDIVQVQTGQIISVDGIVFSANRLGMDQSSITGESNLVRKEDIKTEKKEGMIENPFLISGSKVIEGTSHMIVLAVGPLTRQGMNRLKLQGDDDPTPLQEKLQVLAGQIGNIGVFSASMTFIALLIHFFHDRISKSECIMCYEGVGILVEYFIIAVSIIVMAVPEGLPLAVTISLAYSVGKMKDEHNLVRYIQACQTMGGANNICTDKTGTLTKNQMTVTKVWAQQKQLQSIPSRDISGNTKELLCLGVCVNSDANPQFDSSGRMELFGNKTECALLEMAYKFGYDYSKFRVKENLKAILPFSSARKKMSTAYQKSDRSLVMFTKGGPDFLLPLCTHYISRTGEPLPIDNQFNQEVHDTVERFAAESLRTLLLCYKRIDAQTIKEGIEHHEDKLTIIGIVGIKDPLRPEIPQAVKSCKRAGIIVRMVTGDNINTAIAIAKEAGILPSNYAKPKHGEEEGDIRGQYIVMEGKTFRTLIEGVVPVEEPKSKRGSIFHKAPEGEEGEEEGHKKDPHIHKERIKNMDKFRQIVKELRVLARSSPEDKYMLAIGLKQMENVVAMTGDGTNDAPALKHADIGFAMNIAGTEVAKQAAAILLLDDNFSSIVTAAKYGRNIFECIRKFLQFQLTVNIVAIFMAFIGAVIIKDSPLTSIQMLWVNLIMDTLAALALATQSPKEELLLKMPYRRHENIITPEMWRFVSFHAIFQIAVLSIVLFKGDDIFGVPSQLNMPQLWEWTPEGGKHFTLFFNVFVFLQVFNFLNARKLKKDEINVVGDIFDNKLFVIIVIGIFVLQLFIVQRGGKAFELSPLSMKQHLACILIGSLAIVNGILVKTLIPESWLNKSKIWHIDEENERPYNVDRYINKIIGGYSTDLRKSDKKKEKERARRSQRYQ